MGKKKKNKEGGRGLFSKRNKHLIIRLTLIGLLALAAYALYDPSIISNSQIRSQVESVRNQAGSLNLNSQEKLASFVAGKPNLSFLDKYLPQGAVLGDKQVSVDELLGQAAEKLKQLPASQVERIKADFCAGYIATPSAFNQ